VHGYRKQGAAYGYTHTLGYHPLLATRADTGEVLHARQRTGRANTARGAARFVDELAARVRRAGASGELTMRADSGFWSAKTIRACRRHEIRYSITVRQTAPIRAAIAAIAEDAWTQIVYPEGGLAQVAETRYRGDRLIVRRTRLLGAQAELLPTWRYHAFVTNRVGTTVWLDQDHRRHAVVELCIRDLKAGVGLRYCPSGSFAALTDRGDVRVGLVRRWDTSDGRESAKSRNDRRIDRPPLRRIEPRLLGCWQREVVYTSSRRSSRCSRRR
jgi:hypothetical protein